MHRILKIIIAAFAVFLISASCRSTRHIKQVIATKEPPALPKDTHREDSIKAVQETLSKLSQRQIDFKTFSSKIKVDVTDSKGKQPELMAVMRMVKDSAIWLSLSATFLNIEIYRVLITPAQVILLDKQAKEVQYRTLDYLQEVTKIPFDFKTLQDLLIGNPVFFDTSITSYRNGGQTILITAIGEYFKNLLTLDAADAKILRCKLDDVDQARNRTADITYSDYSKQEEYLFAETRHISISEKNNIDIHMNFKQVEFNKELSVGFSVPKNYKPK